MGLFKWLFGDPDSLEAKVAGRIRQARNRDIRRKAIDVVMELGNGSHYNDEKIEITMSYYEGTEYLDCTPYNDEGHDYGKHKESFSLNINSHHHDLLDPKCYDEYGHVTQVFPTSRVSFGEVRDYCREYEREAVIYRYEVGAYGKYYFPCEIDTYISGEWETYLDELYRKIPQLRKEKEERVKREQEGILRKEREDKTRRKQQAKQEEQARKLHEIADKKKRFGL